MDRDLTDKAKAWLSDLSAAGNNFIMSLGYKLPHLPWITPKQPFFDQFNGKINVPDNMELQNNLPDPAFNDGAELRAYGDMKNIATWKGGTTETLSNSKTIELRQAYYSSVSYVDSLIGEVIQSLKENNLYDNTIIIVTSDRGYHLGEHNIWTKNTNFEVALQVPLYISAPDYRNAPRTTSKLVELVDLFPTMVQLAGLGSVEQCGDLAASSVTTLCTEGTSLVPLLTSDVNWNKNAVFHQYLRGNKMGLSIRTKDYRYTYWVLARNKVWSWDNKQFGKELYDLTTDTYENTNLATDNAYATIMADLHDKLKAGWRSQLPSSAMSTRESSLLRLLRDYLNL